MMMQPSIGLFGVNFACTNKVCVPSCWSVYYAEAQPGGAPWKGRAGGPGGRRTQACSELEALLPPSTDRQPRWPPLSPTPQPCAPQLQPPPQPMSASHAQ